MGSASAPILTPLFFHIVYCNQCVALFPRGGQASVLIHRKTLIVTLPGKPAAIKLCLDAVFPAIPYCLELIEAGFLDTHKGVVDSFRPKQ